MFMKKEKTIPVYRKLWLKIRYWQGINLVSNEELAKIIGVTTRTISNYDKDASSISLQMVDNFLVATRMDLITLYNL